MAARQTPSGFSSSDGDLLLGQDLYPSDKSQRNSRTLPAAVLVYDSNPGPAPNPSPTPNPNPAPNPDPNPNQCAMIRKDHMHAVLTGGVGKAKP